MSFVSPHADAPYLTGRATIGRLELPPSARGGTFGRIGTPLSRGKSHPRATPPRRRPTYNGLYGPGFITNNQYDDTPWTPLATPPSRHLEPPFSVQGGTSRELVCREIEHPCLQNRDCARGLLSVLWSTRGVFGPFFLSPNPPQGPSCPLTYFDARPVSSPDLRSPLQIWNSPPGPAFLHPNLFALGDEISNFGTSQTKKCSRRETRPSGYFGNEIPHS